MLLKKNGELKNDNTYVDTMAELLKTTFGTNDIATRENFDEHIKVKHSCF